MFRPGEQIVNRRFGGKYHLRLQSRKLAGQETIVQQVAGHNMSGNGCKELIRTAVN
jgi:hypothetical protein